MRITVGIIGGGSWGTTVGHLAAHNVSTVLWARHAETAEEINSHHRNSRYLDGFDLHPALRATADLGEAVRTEQENVARHERALLDLRADAVEHAGGAAVDSVVGRSTEGTR